MVWFYLFPVSVLRDFFVACIRNVIYIERMLIEGIVRSVRAI